MPARPLAVEDNAKEKCGFGGYMACERRLDQEDSWATNTTIAVAIRSRALARLSKNGAGRPKPTQHFLAPHRARASLQALLGAGQTSREDPQPVWAAGPIRQQWEPESCSWNAMRLRATFLGSHFLRSTGYYVDRTAVGGLNRLQIVRPSIFIEEDFRLPLRRFGRRPRLQNDGV